MPTASPDADLGIIPATQPQAPDSDLGIVPAEQYNAPKSDDSDLGIVPQQDYATQKTNDHDFDPAAYAAQHFDNQKARDFAYSIDKARKNRSFGDKAAEFGSTLVNPSTYVEAGKGVAKFGAGLIAAPLHTVAQAGLTAAAPVLRFFGADNVADAAEREALTEKSEATLAGQNIEGSLRNIARVGNKYLNPESYTDGADRQDFDARVQAARDQMQLQQGNPLDTGFVAGLSRLTSGEDPSQSLSAEALKDAGARPASQAFVESAAAAGDPTNLALAEIPLLPGMKRLGAETLKVAGSALAAPGNALERAITAASTHVPFVPNLAAKAAIGTTGLTGIYGARRFGQFLTQAGRESAGEALAPADRGIFGSLASNTVKGASHALPAAVGFAPINFALSEGDPKKFAESTVGAGVFGGTFGTASEMTNDALAGRFANADRTRLGTPTLSTAPFDYNTTPDLDAAHNQTVAQMPEGQQAEINQIRHAMQGHLEYYVLPEAEFNQQAADYAKRVGIDGQEISAQGFMDDQTKDGVNRVIVKAGVSDPIQTGWHEIGHDVTNSMAPADRTRAIAALVRANDMDAFTKRYATALYGPQHEGLTWATLPETAQDAQAAGLPSNLNRASMGDELLSEQTASMMRGVPIDSLTNGNKTAKRRLQDIAGRVAEKLGYKVTSADAKSILQVNPSFAAAHIIEQSLAARATGAGLAPAYGGEVNARNRIAQLDAVLAKPPTGDSSVEQVKAYQAAQRERESLAKTVNAPQTGFPGAQQPAGLPGLRQTKTRTASENAVIPAIVKLHGGTTADAREAVRAVQQEAGSTPHTTPEAIINAVNERANRLKGIGAPKAQKPVPTAPVDRVFRDQNDNELKVTGESANPAKEGDFVVTSDGNIRRVAKVRDGGDLDVTFPASRDTRSSQPVKAGEYKVLIHEPIQQASTGDSTLSAALKIVPGRAGSFDIVNEKGDVVKSGLADETAANRSLAQLQKEKPSKFTIPPSPSGSPDIIDKILEHGGIQPGKKGDPEYDQPENLRGVYQQMMGGRMTPDDMARILAEGDPQQGIHGIGDGTVTGMWKAIEDAIEQRKSMRAQQTIEESRIAQEKKQTSQSLPGEANEKSTTDEPFSESPEQPTQVIAPPAPTAEPTPVPHSPDVGEFDRIAAEAKEAFLASKAVAKTGKNKGQHTQENQRLAAREGFFAAAKAHAEDLPENYQGIGYHVDQFGRESVSGRIDPSRPFDQWLIQQATDAGHMSPAILKTMLDFQNNFRKTISWDYDSANLAKYGQEPTGEERRLMQSEQKASGRVAGKDGMQTTVKTGIPLTITYNHGEKSFNVIGESQPKLLNNFNFVRDVFGKMGKTMPFRNINDPRLAEVIQGGIKNHQNDWKFDGSAPMTGTQAYEASPTPDYKPFPMTKDEANFINVLFANESLKSERGGKVTPEAEAKQEFANVNKAPWTATGESNQLRQEINDFVGPVQRMALEKNDAGEIKLVPKTDKEGNPLTTSWSKTWLEDPLNEAIRPELAQKIGPPRQGEEAIRQHGYTGDIAKLLEGGKPNQAAVPANFMPAADDSNMSPKERAQQRILARQNAERDDSIYRQPGKTIDISSDTQSLPKGWSIQQDGGLWIAYDQNGKRVPDAATGSRAGTMARARIAARGGQFMPDGQSPQKEGESSHENIDPFTGATTILSGHAAGRLDVLRLARQKYEADGLPVLDQDRFMVQKTPGGNYQSTGTLNAIGTGGESQAFESPDGSIYKIFRKTGESGIGQDFKVARRQSDGAWQSLPSESNLQGVLDKLRILTRIGGIPSEPLAVLSNGDLIVKQPRAPEKETSQQERASVLQKALVKPVPKEDGSNLHEKGMRVTVVDGKPYLINDFDPSNFMRDNQNDPRITDTIIGELPKEALNDLPKLRAVINTLKSQERIKDRSDAAFMPATEDLHIKARLERLAKDRPLTTVEQRQLARALQQIKEDSEGPGDAGAEMAHNMRPRMMPTTQDLAKARIQQRNLQLAGAAGSAVGRHP